MSIARNVGISSLVLAAVAAFAGYVGWHISIEVRLERALNVDRMIEVLEETVRPLVVEYEVSRRLAEHPFPMTDEKAEALEREAAETVNRQINKGRQWEQR